MRLLIVTQAVDLDDPVLGFFHRWIEEFSKHSDLVSVICLKEGRHKLPGNVQVYSLGKEGGLSRLRYIIRFFKYTWSLRKSYDSVFVHMNPEYVVLAGVLWRVWGKRVMFWYTHKSVTWKLRLATIISHDIFTASTESFRLASKKVQVVGHGIDTEQFVFREKEYESPLQSITIGRLSRTKRVSDIIEAVAAAQRAGHACVLKIVGAPITHEDEEYERLLRARAQPSLVTFVGAIPHNQLPHMLDGAHVFIHLSETGSIDKAVLESLASGVLVITTSEAFRPLLEPFGLFVSPDDVEHVGRAIQSFNQRTDKAAVATVLARTINQQHSLKRLIPRMLNAH